MSARMGEGRHRETGRRVGLAGAEDRAVLAGFASASYNYAFLSSPVIDPPSLTRSFRRSLPDEKSRCRRSSTSQLAPIPDYDAIKGACGAWRNSSDLPKVRVVRDQGFGVNDRLDSKKLRQDWNRLSAGSVDIVSREPGRVSGAFSSRWRPAVGGRRNGAVVR